MKYYAWRLSAVDDGSGTDRLYVARDDLSGRLYLTRVESIRVETSKEDLKAMLTNYTYSRDCTISEVGQ